MLKNIHFRIVLVSSTHKHFITMDDKITDEVTNLITANKGLMSTSESSWDFLVTNEFSVNVLATRFTSRMARLLQAKPNYSQFITPATLKKFVKSETVSAMSKAALNVFNHKIGIGDISRIHLGLSNYRGMWVFKTIEGDNRAKVRHALFDSDMKLNRQGILKKFLDRMSTNEFASIETTFKSDFSKAQHLFNNMNMNSAYGTIPLDCWLHVFQYLTDLEMSRTIATCKLFHMLGKYVRNAFYKSLCFQMVKHSDYLAKYAPKKRNLRLATLQSEKDYFMMAVNHLFPMVLEHHISSRPNCPYINLDIQKLQRDDSSVGGTFFGGLPDLAHGLIWPMNYSFLCQINCQDICELFGARNSVPNKGILYFFLGDRDTNVAMLYSSSDDPNDLTANTEYPYGDPPTYYPRAKMKLIDSMRRIVLDDKCTNCAAFGGGSFKTIHLSESRGFYINLECPDADIKGVTYYDRIEE